MSDLQSTLDAVYAHALRPITAYDQFPRSDNQLFTAPELRPLMQLLGSVSPEDAGAVLHGLLPAIRNAAPFQAGRLALLCGSLVEAGADPGIAVDTIVSRLPAVLTEATWVLERFSSGIDPESLFPVKPEAVNAWKALRYLVLPAMAMLTRDGAARQRARARADLREALPRVRPYHTDAQFLDRLFDLTDGKPMLVLHPGQGKGFRVELWAVSSVPHLFTLLQGALLGPESEGGLAGPAPNAEAVAAARGQLFPDKPVSDHALFHVYAWRALDPDPSSSNLDFAASIWADSPLEGLPPFEGVPTLLLGPLVLGRRGWDSDFFPQFHDALRPEVRVLSRLSAGEVSELLARMRAQLR